MEKKEITGSGLINAGIYIMNTSALQKIPDKTPTKPLKKNMVSAETANSAMGK